MKFVLRQALVFLLSLLSLNLSAQNESYKSTLLKLCNTLIATQISNSSDLNYGALVCPSSNPDDHPLHSRAAEAVYPFAVAWRLTGEIKYRDAAIKLGNWLIRIQDTTGKKTGGWSEAWPDPEQKGWYGTTTDQLISLAGAFPILKPFMSDAEIEKWNNSMKRAGEFIMVNFPVRSNINYNPTAAATLLLAYRAMKNPDDRWLIKADSLMDTYTLKSVTAQNFLSGEGMGVDEGYNISQSIGYIALYAILKDDSRIKRIAADLLRTHMLFVYPNGSVDNSWGTRSFKWSYESGTKTAPGIYFSFALLGDMDTDFNSAGLECLRYLNEKCIQNGWINYGPHSKNHETSSPPCNYSTFARAQSLALAIEYGTQAETSTLFPAQKQNWYRFFPDLKVAVVRTGKIMSTVSAYGEIGRYPRASVCRGGSITNLWYEGYGENGFMQSSSTSSYKRIEPMHMPNEKELLPLTSRIEFNIDSVYFSNVFEADGKMNVIQLPDNISISTEGNMQTINGIKSKVNYVLTNRFYDSYITKEFRVEGNSQSFRIIEPFVNDPGSTFILKNDSTVAIRTNSSDTEWELRIIGSTVPFKITLGTDAAKYWCPFPAVEAYPVIISFNTQSAVPQTVKIYLGKKDDAHR
jgi:hypothetical protein